MPRRTRQTAALELLAASPSKRSKQDTQKATQQKKKGTKPRPTPKKKAVKKDKKQEPKPKQVQDKKDKTKKERFLEKVDTFFIKHINELTCQRENLRIFVPLCGNSADMLWLSEQGHSVVGVEMTSKWIRSFFKNSELEYDMTSEEMATKKIDVYRAKAKDIVIYHCSIFDFHWSGDKFDGIWDQSAMPVINEMGEEKMKDYVELLQALLDQDGRHVVEICRHGANFVTTERLQQLYGEKSEVRYFGTRMWKYEEEEEEEEGEDESHAQLGHAQHSHASDGHAGHDHHHDDQEETEMFYHVISFK